MKGVVLGIAPRAQIVDITHEIAPYELSEAAFVIAQAWRHFPKRTIHVVVVDPGVGSARRPIVVEAGGHYFIGPDNGVLSMICDGPRIKVREISNPKYMRKDVSRTFHGRDIFAPAAAHLSLGVPLSKFGKTVPDYIRLSLAKSTEFTKNQWSGTILKVDRFGNLITNFHISDFPGAKMQPIELRIGVERIHRLALTYAETDIGEVFAIVGSSGYIEVAANQASAAKTLGCGAGTPVELEVYF
jgi:S-adenosylmethionine hydrolase